ncbi:MAG: hypothetical protein LBD44_06425, partial [Spirochaetaceae bacterium]|nr:hypothetical protein [Spirochaetaceae bacterium]
MAKITVSRCVRPAGAADSWHCYTHTPPPPGEYPIEFNKEKFDEEHEAWKAAEQQNYVFVMEGRDYVGMSDKAKYVVKDGKVRAAYSWDNYHGWQ